MKNFITLACLFAVGCGSVNPHQSFSSLQKTIKAHTGETPYWMRDSTANGKVEQAIRPLLEKELTMAGAVRVALLNNRSLQATYEEIGISQADLVQAGLLKNPQLFASFRFPDRPPLAADTEYSIAEDVVDFIIRPLRKKIAAAQLEQTQLRVSDEVLRLIADVKTAFYTMQAREQLLGRLRVILAANAAAAELAQQQFDAGTINELDLVNQQSLGAQTQLELVQAEAQARLDREKLNRLMGVWGANTQWKVAAQLPAIPVTEAPLDRLESLALSQRFDLAAASNQLAMVTRALAWRKNTRFLPASVEVGFDAERTPDRQWVRGPTVELDVPLFDQGQGQVGRLQAQVRQSQHWLEALAMQIRSEVSEASAIMNANRTAAEIYRRSLLPGRARILNLTLQQYNFMLKGTYDLLQAKQQEAQTERAYIETCRDYWIGYCELERAVGGRIVVEAPHQRPLP